MLGENFVYFFTVQGFFVGVIFGILKSSSANELLSYALLITVFFYLFSHIIIAFYYKTKILKSYYFPREEHEKALDYFVVEINKRERVIDSAIKITQAAMKTNAQTSEENYDK